MADANLDRVTHVGDIQALGPGASNRFVVAPDNFDGQSPFVLLVEDFIGPQSAFHEHPHRGIETVTFLIEGALEHRDHLGSTGVLLPGDIQRMTAGRGIMHGGKPYQGTQTHALQLWLNLPAALKASAPGTREQRRDQAIVHEANGVIARKYGAPTAVSGRAAWSRWPTTLTDVELAAGADYNLAINADDRMFLYVLSGKLQVGSDRRELSAGQIGWSSPVANDQSRTLPLRAETKARFVAYSARPISEPVVAQGPFVMNTQEEIHQAYADYRANTFLRAAA